MLDAHAYVMQVKLCKANTRGVTDEVAGDGDELAHGGGGHRGGELGHGGGGAWPEQRRRWGRKSQGHK